jgi:recombinational DNA repair protein RecR
MTDVKKCACCGAIVSGDELFCGACARRRRDAENFL